MSGGRRVSPQVRASVSSVSGSSDAFVELEALKLCINRVKELSEKVVELSEKVVFLESGGLSSQILDLEQRFSVNIEKRFAEFKAELTASTDPWGKLEKCGNQGKPAHRDVHDLPEKDCETQRFCHKGETKESEVASSELDVVSPTSASAVHPHKPPDSDAQAPTFTETTIVTETTLVDVSVDESTNTKENISFEDVSHVEEAPWDTSIWNMSFFMCHRAVGKLGTLQIFIILFLNVFTQGVFLLVTSQILTEENFTDETIHHYEKWRLDVGQNVKYYDELSFTSLAERVCAEEQPEMSGGIRGELEAMQKYMPPDGASLLDFLRSGPSLHMVALMCWSLTSLGEGANIIRDMTAMTGLRRTRRTNISFDQDKYNLNSVSRGRLIGYMIVLLVRSFICILLWHQGALFLIRYTIDPADLILNAVALEVVLNVDQAFYVLAPTRSKNLLENMNPLKCPVGRPIKRFQCGLDLKSIVLTMSFLLFTFSCYVLEIDPLIKHISEANKAICGGKTDFVYAVDPMYFVYSSPTNPFHEDYEETLKYPHIEAINERIHDDVPSFEVGHIVIPVPLSKQFMGKGVGVVKQHSTFTMDEAVEALSTGMNCESNPLDHFDPSMQRFMAHLTRSKFGGFDPEMMHCDDVVRLDMCHISEIFRAVCPVSCECDMPFGPGLWHPEDGCPHACSHTDRGHLAVKEALCSEKTPADLREDRLWVAWASAIGAKIEKTMGKAYLKQRLMLCSGGGGNCTELFLVHGCGAITLLSEEMEKEVDDPGDICGNGELNRDFDLIMRPFATMCPVTCKCTENADESLESLVDRHCPGTCAR